jgi:hypothetical protein
MKYTPGPWKWWTSNSWKRLKRADHPSEPVLTPYTCKDGQPDVEISYDNMTLIAAAPDLLEALENMVELFAGYQGMQLTKAREAIAKAKGAS